MELSLKGLEDVKAWKNAGFNVPEFNHSEVARKTYEMPFWVHFGAGNIFRAFQANAVQKLLNNGNLDVGLVVAEGFDYEIITKMNKPHDNLSILATLCANGDIEKTVVGSVMESYVLDSNDEESYSQLKRIFASRSLEMASFTITEKGYSLTNARGEVLESVAKDWEMGPAKPESYIGKVVSLLYHRFENGRLPIAMVSMDNCSHNGDKLKEAVVRFAKEWTKSGLCDAEFEEYVTDNDKVSYPWTMIDKITPRPDETVRKMLEEAGVEGLDTVVTSKNTYIAPFVNSEECEYLVIEDDFPNGRHSLEKAGFYFTDRNTVDLVERMKVCTCLNPLHTALAIFGCLLGYTKISDEMKDEQLLKLVETIGYVEGLLVVDDPKIINPKEFIDTVLKVRVPNPFMPDTPQRIATDTSQKLPIRYGETIKRYAASKESDVSELKLIPLVFAGWIRYLMGIDDEGKKFELSPDPCLDELVPIVSQISMQADSVRELEAVLKPIVSDERIFGVDLYKVGLSEKVYDYLIELLNGEGAVRRTLKKYCK